MPDEKMAFPYQQAGGGELPDFMELIGAPDSEAEINQNITEANVHSKVTVLEKRPPDPPLPTQNEKKLTMAEIQRMKINAASEAYRKLRESGNNDQVATTEIGPPPPLIPTNSQPFQQPPMPMQQPPQPRMAQFQLGQPHATHLQQAAAAPPPKPNIDLGAVVRSTIINGVTKTFSQVNLDYYYYLPI